MGDLEDTILEIEILLEDFLDMKPYRKCHKRSERCQEITEVVFFELRIKGLSAPDM